MTQALSNLFSCTGKISTIKYDLKFGKVVEGEDTRRQEGELARLEGIREELVARLTEDEQTEWNKGYRQIQISEDERRKREKAMDMENVDRDSI